MHWPKHTVLLKSSVTGYKFASYIKLDSYLSYSPIIKSARTFLVFVEKNLLSAFHTKHKITSLTSANILYLHRIKKLPEHTSKPAFFFFFFFLQKKFGVLTHARYAYLWQWTGCSPQWSVTICTSNLQPSFDTTGGSPPPPNMKEHARRDALTHAHARANTNTSIITP